MKVERKFVVNQLQALEFPANVRKRLAGSQWADNPNTIFRSSQINLGIGFATPSSPKRR